MSPVRPVKEGQRVTYVRPPGRIPTSGFSPLYSRITRRHHRHRHPRNHTGRASTSLRLFLLPPAQRRTSQAPPGRSTGNKTNKPPQNDILKSRGRTDSFPKSNGSCHGFPPAALTPHRPSRSGSCSARSSRQNLPTRMAPLAEYAMKLTGAVSSVCPSACMRDAPTLFREALSRSNRYTVVHRSFQKTLCFLIH